jgi:hypothetical protein
VGSRTWTYNLQCHKLMLYQLSYTHHLNKASTIINCKVLFVCFYICQLKEFVCQSYSKEATISNIKSRKKIYCNKLIFQKLKSTGNSKVNSISYKIKKIHNIVKFIFICMFISDNDLNPHSQKCLLLGWFFIL